MNPHTATAPFSCTYTPNLPELLTKLNCSIVISTFQAGKIVMLSPQDENTLFQLVRDFNKPMGVALKEDWMAVATESEVILLKDSPELAKTFPHAPNTYDHFYFPRSTYYTGNVDIHDLHFGKNGELWAVNTSFSALCTIGNDYSFSVNWTPPFISSISSGDRCHLNGLAMKDGEPEYVSALGTGDTPQSWRENITKGGAIIHIPSKEVVATGLAMPHTPRLYDGKLYCLLSAAQELVCIDVETGKYDVVAHIPGFVRGMDRIGDYLCIATSKLRKNSSTFRHLQIADAADKATITMLHLPTASIVSRLEYQMSVDEIYDVQLLPDALRPNLFNTTSGMHNQVLHLPKATFWAMPSQQKPPQRKVVQKQVEVVT